jgi:hypothetical protein
MKISNLISLSGMFKKQRIIMLVPVLFFISTVNGQNVSPTQISLASFEKYYYEKSDIVILGSFESITDYSFDAPPLKNKKVSAHFRIKSVFKGDAILEGTELELGMDSDMLVTPGGDDSRYSERRSVYTNLRDRFIALDAQRIENLESFQNGNLSEQEFDSINDRLVDEIDSILPQMSQDELTVGSLRVIDGDSFYDLGGAIKPDEDYLLYLTRYPNGDIALDPVMANSIIIWGDNLPGHREYLESL